MSYKKRGVRDGSGPYKGSYQRKTSNVGRRIQLGQKWVKKK